MTDGGHKLAVIRRQVAKAVKPGVSLATLDNLATKLILAAGGQPGFKLVPGYHWTTCINLNSGIVHGIPYPHIFIKSGDLVSLDMGMFYQGFHTDTSTSLVAGTPTPFQARFLAIGQQALKEATAVAKVGHHIGHISQAIQNRVEGAGLTCMRNLTGHGVGAELHEPPSIPCFVKAPITSTPLIEAGMTLAIEVIYAAGSYETTHLDDDWTIVTQDNQIAGLFEDTILVTKNGPQILTQ